jgi:hypothetical protein
MDMPNRAMKMLPAILGGILVGLSLTAVSQAAEPAKDCLTAPGQPTQGGHWYYRLDRPTKRHCWYVRAEGQAAAAQLASSSAEPAAAPVGAPLQPSVANARAEIAPAATTRPTPPIGSSMTVVANRTDGAAVPSTPPMLNDPSRTLAERWSDHPDANRPAEAAPPNMVASMAPQQQQPTTVRQGGDSAGYSVWMLVSALVGTLALVGVATAVIANFNRAIAITRHDDPQRTRSIWDAPPGNKLAASDAGQVDAGSGAPMSWIRIARETQEARRLARRVADRRDDEIEHLLSQAARRPAV